MDEITLIELLRKYQSVYIYGAGNVAKVIIKYLKNTYPYISISAIVVTKYKDNPYYIYGIPVIQINELGSIKKDIVLIATIENTQKEIISLLDAYEIKNIVCMQDALLKKWNYNLLLLKEDKQISRYITPYLDLYIDTCYENNMSDIEIRTDLKKIIPQIKSKNLNLSRLVVVLGTKCSLKCKDCNNLIPYFNPQLDLDEKNIINDLQNITNKTQSILKCELIGGEPFMAQNVNGILKYMIDNPVIKYVEITTNGTIVPNKELGLLMQNPKVLVRISDYGTQVNKNKIIQFLTMYNIRYIILNLGSWVSPGGVHNRKRTKKELEECYKRCSSGYYCKTLYDGKIFSCARAASLYALGYMKEKEYVDVRQEFDIQSMKNFLLQDYSAACNYCDISIDNKVYVSPAIQL